MATTITVRGMSCEGCEDIVENALEEVDGVESVAADQTDGTATVEGAADRQDLVEAAGFAGYDADSDSDADESEAETEESEGA
jgi:copper chaperone CopZ